MLYEFAFIIKPRNDMKDYQGKKKSGYIIKMSTQFFYISKNLILHSIQPEYSTCQMKKVCISFEKLIIYYSGAPLISYQLTFHTSLITTSFQSMKSINILRTTRKRGFVNFHTSFIFIAKMGDVSLKLTVFHCSFHIYPKGCLICYTITSLNFACYYRFKSYLLN